ncbi:MAG TPA: PEP-CTERM sorting domain-containing protein [Vicinamibacterales bacterium]|nr:PEP-CTERM sorting domain-containing protein [Vicinamibacterales bacterium]
MRVLTCLLGLTIATLSLPFRASADTIVDVASFAFSGTNFAFDGFQIQPFDPLLGTLDEVSIGITGVLNVSAPTLVLPLPPPPGGPGGFLGYSYRIDVTNEFVGLFGNLFELSPEAQFAFTGFASGAGEQAVFSQLFTYGFTLTNITDLIGFAPVDSSGVTIPPFAVAQRSDFLPTLADQYVMETRFAGSFTQGIPTPISLSGGGTVQTTYRYTPTPVPEPTTLFLFVTGTLGLLAARRKPPTG